MAIFCRNACLPALISIAILSTAAGAEAAEEENDPKPWENGAFSSSSAEMLDAAGRLSPPEDADVWVLYLENYYSYDEQRRETVRRHLVYKILDETALDGWSVTEWYWEPWHQQRPAFQARVMTPAGKVYQLDPKTITDSPAHEDSQQLFDDARVLRAPLPGTAAGVLVEEWIEVQETRPLTEAGLVRSLNFQMWVPVRHSRVVIEAPSGLPLRYRVRKADITPQVSEKDGRRRLVFEGRNWEPREYEGFNYPPDVARDAGLDFSTGSSWAAVAANYAQIVEEKLQVPVESPLLEEEPPADPQQRAEFIARLLSSLQRQVRYTGLEFGASGIIPWTPRQTVDRQYGDCKDQATLLVSELRRAGIPASVALLSTGPGKDVNPDLPGLGQFDHAIVYIPGPPEVWVDPTSPYARPGEIPSPDQGRLALIAHPGTKGLAATPVLPAARNMEVQTIEVYLPDYGKARVIDTSVYSGHQEQNIRAYAHGKSPKEAEEWLKGYAKTSLLSDLVDFSYTDPLDLSDPFQLRVEAQGAGFATAERQAASVAFGFASLLSSLPYEFEPEEEDSEEEQAEDEEEAPRTEDHYLDEPFAGELRYRIHPAEGFAAQQLPESRTRQYGPALFSEEYRVTDSGAVEADFRFELDQQRISAQQFEELQKGISEMRSRPTTVIRFKQSGEALLAAGKVDEALEEFRRLSRLKPDSPLPRSRMSAAFLAVGLGEEARQEARRAVEMAPDSPFAHSSLAWALQHDLVGRLRSPGFELQPSIDAYRKALELDEDNSEVHSNLAILLEFNSKGIRYGQGADLDAAIREYHAFREHFDSEYLDNNLMISLMRAGRFEELLEAARTLETSKDMTEFEVIGLAMTQGPDEAVRLLEESRSDAQQRLQLLQAVGQKLILVRAYQQASDLYRRAGAVSPNAAALLVQAEMLSRMSPYEGIELPQDDPASVIKSFFLSILFEEDLSLAAIKNSFHSRLRNDLSWEGADEFNFGSIRQKAVQASGVPIPVLADFLMGAAQFQNTGSDELGYRIKATFAGVDQPVAFYVVLEEGEYKLAGISSDPARLALEVLDRLEQGDQQAAARWLEWVSDDLPAADPRDPLSAPALRHFWRKGQTASPQELRIAAATVLASKDFGAEKARLILTKGLKGQKDLRKDAIQASLAEALQKLEKAQESLKLAQNLHKRHPASERAFQLHAAALGLLKKPSQIRKLAQERLSQLPDDLTALRTLGSLARKEGDWEEAERISRQIFDSGKAQGSDYNSQAWAAAAAGHVDDSALEWGRKAAEMGKYADTSSLHTLATLYAETGQSSEAYRLLIQAVNARQFPEVRSDDWYVLGRISETLQLPESARKYYRRVNERDDPDSTYRMAQRRLAELGDGERP